MKIITSVVNNPTFIEIQHYTFHKYFKGEFEFIVFNDAKEFSDYTNSGDLTIKNKIYNICKKLNIKCINIPNNHHKKLNKMTDRHADIFNNYVLKYQKNNPDKYLLIDSDMFLIDYFDIKKYEKYDCGIVLQKRENDKYFWPGLCYMNFNIIQNIHLLNWDCVHLPISLDSGGMMKHWLQLQVKKPDTIYYIKHLWSCSWDEINLPKNIAQQNQVINFLKTDPRNKNNKFFCEIYDDVFLHYRAGGNWMKEGMTLHNDLTEKLKNILMN